LLGLCVRADPDTLFTGFVLFGDFKSFEAVEPTFLEVCSFLAIVGLLSTLSIKSITLTSRLLKLILPSSRYDRLSWLPF